MQPAEHEVPDLEPSPLMFRPPELVEGYYQLAWVEHYEGMGALARHGEEVAIWYRLLTLHRRAFLGGFHLPGPGDELVAHGPRMQLLGLTSSKAALDLLLVGYYSVALAAIPPMIES